MSCPIRPRHSTQGLALVMTVVMLALLLGGIVVVAFALTFSTRASAADGRDGLKAALAAESGLAHLRAHLAEVRSALEAVSIPGDEAPETIDALVARFCGGRPWRGPRCEAPATTAPGAFDVFARYGPPAPSSSPWREVERGAVLVGAPEGTFEARVSLVPLGAERTPEGEYRLRLRVSALESVGELARGSARRRVREEGPGEVVVTLSKRPLNRFALLREAGVVFAGDTFDGPVHVGGASVLEAASPPRFAAFSSVEPPTVRGDLGCAPLRACRHVFSVAPTFAARAVAFPDPAAWWSDAAGRALRIEGDVSRLTLSVRGGVQLVEAVQANETTTLRLFPDGRYEVARGGTVVEAGPAFGGLVLVNGSVLDMRGDGTVIDDAGTAPLTLAASGSVSLSGDVTAPRGGAPLGLVSLGDLRVAGHGDLALHAHVAVLGEGNGLASASCASFVACRTVGAPLLSVRGSLAERAARPLAHRLDVRHTAAPAPPAFPREANWTVDARSLASAGTWRQLP